MEETNQTDPCKTCSKTFSKQADLDEHLEWHNLQIQHEKSITMEETNQTNPCKTCSKIFSKQADLDVHLEWHNLQIQHMQSSYVKLDRVEIFKCDYCSRGFLDYKKSKQHQMNYFQKNTISTSEDNNNQFEKPYKCQECGWKFVKKSTLEAHSILHQPFLHKCHCGIGYYKKCDLDSHRRLVHPIFKPVNSARKVKTEVSIKSETQSESEPEQADDKVYYKPHSKVTVEPKLKATLKYKKQNNTSRNKRSIKKHIKRNDKNLDIKKDEMGNYICQICAKTYSNKSSLNVHMLNIHAEMQYKCDECPKEFSTIARMLRHKFCHANIRNFTCNICTKKFKTKHDLEVHILTHTGEKPNACHLCPKAFSQSGALKIHLLRHAGVKNFECDKCDKKFYDAGSLHLHQRTHTGEKPYECKECGKCFADPSAYKRHLLIHTGLKPYRCDRCPKAFCDPSALFVHKRRHSNWNVQCSYCDKSYRSRSQMLNHIKISHRILKKEEKFECDYCLKDFPLKSYLVIHITNMHLKMGRNVLCHICDKEYASQVNLEKHLKCVHLKQKCDVCETTCICNKDLKKRKITRDIIRVKDYECDHCHATFCTKADVMKHIGYKHLGIKCKECKAYFFTTLKLKQHKSKGCRRCTVCKMAFSSETALKNHFTLHHLPKSEWQVYECNYCCKQFPIKASLQKHVKGVHETIELKFFCEHCNEKFSKRIAIIDHIWDKHMVSLYCHICMKRFYNDHEFQQHQRAGCRRKKLSCDVCEKTFTTTSQLRSHQDIHLPKMKTCDMCGAKFKRKSGVKRHLKLVHGFQKKVKLGK